MVWARQALARGARTAACAKCWGATVRHQESEPARPAGLGHGQLPTRGPSSPRPQSALPAAFKGTRADPGRRRAPSLPPRRLPTLPTAGSPRGPWRTPPREPRPDARPALRPWPARRQQGGNATRSPAPRPRPGPAGPGAPHLTSPPRSPSPPRTAAAAPPRCPAGPACPVRGGRGGGRPPPAGRGASLNP